MKNRNTFTFLNKEQDATPKFRKLFSGKSAERSRNITASTKTIKSKFGEYTLELPDKMLKTFSRDFHKTQTSFFPTIDKLVSNYTESSKFLPVVKTKECAITTAENTKFKLKTVKQKKILSTKNSSISISFRRKFYNNIQESSQNLQENKELYKTMKLIQMDKQVQEYTSYFNEVIS